MRRLAFALLLSLPAMACQQSAPLMVKDAWVRDSVGRTANAAVFMTITSPTDDRLIAASAPVAKKTDLMTMESAGGTMGMKYLETIRIPANEAVSLNPGGAHVWLDDLNQPLKSGQTIPLTLRFEKAGERQISVSIITPTAEPPMEE